MALKASNIILIFTIILCTTTTSISAFNITYFLEQHSEFSTYNNLLTQSGVATAINKQGTVTVLVVDNSAVGPITGVPQSKLSFILATHVILDYYDATKLDNLNGKSVKATNLFQQTGKTNGEQGLLNITNSDGNVIFASSAKGAPQDSKMVKVVSSQPFHISVIQISKPIVTPGLDQGGSSSPSSSPNASPPTSVAAPPPKQANGSAPSPADEEEAADSPMEADSPMAESEGPAPADGPAGGPSPAPSAEDDEADKETADANLAPPKKNGGARLSVGGAIVAVFVGIVALIQ